MRHSTSKETRGALSHDAVGGVLGLITEPPGFECLCIQCRFASCSSLFASHFRLSSTLAHLTKVRPAPNAIRRRAGAR